MQVLNGRQVEKKLLKKLSANERVGQQIQKKQLRKPALQTLHATWSNG